mmetsp:Transcript_8393/g.12411  ORF Transcript_8393/g.12411 Transcript_8393/m.12411 type:complete len:375 (+) Transcript_8393:88-1212(+)
MKTQKLGKIQQLKKNVQKFKVKTKQNKKNRNKRGGTKIKPQSPMQEIQMRRRYREPSIISKRVNYYEEREKYLYAVKPMEEEDEVEIESLMTKKIEEEEEHKTKRKIIVEDEISSSTSSMDTTSGTSEETIHNSQTKEDDVMEEQRTSSQENPHHSTKSSSRTQLNNQELTQWQYFKRYYQQLEALNTFLSKVYDRLESPMIYLNNFSKLMNRTKEEADMDMTNNVRETLLGIVMALNKYMNACEEILKYLSYHFTTSGPLRADAKIIADPYQLFPNLTGQGIEAYQEDNYIDELDTIDSIRMKCTKDPKAFYHFLRMNVIIKLLIQMEHLFSGASKEHTQIFKIPAKLIETTIREFRVLVLKLQVELHVRRRS